jgi:hypothetical protein
MTFKEYLKTPEGRAAAIKLYRKLKKKQGPLPQCKTSNHTDSRTMTNTATLPAAGANQPEMS